MAGGYRVEREIARPSEPRHGPGGGFTRQRVRWNVIAPNGMVVRSFTGSNGKRRALDEIRRRGKRKAALAEAATRPAPLASRSSSVPGAGHRSRSASRTASRHREPGRHPH
jgi:hypothetical protein